MTATAREKMQNSAHQEYIRNIVGCKIEVIFFILVENFISTGEDFTSAVFKHVSTMFMFNFFCSIIILSIAD